jgi:hypothetical protein
MKISWCPRVEIQEGKVTVLLSCPEGRVTAGWSPTFKMLWCSVNLPARRRIWTESIEVGLHPLEVFRDIARLQRRSVRDSLQLALSARQGVELDRYEPLEVLASMVTRRVALRVLQQYWVGQ